MHGSRLVQAFRVHYRFRDVFSKFERVVLIGKVRLVLVKK